MPQPEQRTLLPIGVAALVVVVWGATPVATKIATAQIDPVMVGILRTAVAGIVAAPLALAMGIEVPRGRRAVGLLAVSAFCGFVAFPLLFSIGQLHTSAVHGGLILAALPIFTGFYAALVQRRRPSPGWWSGSALAVAGEAVLVAFRDLRGSSSATLGGDLLILASVLLVSLGYVAGARLAQSGYGSLGATLWGVAFATVLLAPVLPFAIAADDLASAGPAAWGSVLYLALVTTILGYVGWYWALAAGGIARIGLMQFFQPVSGVVLAIVLLGERLTLPLLLAAASILAGVFVAQRR